MIFLRNEQEIQKIARSSRIVAEALYLAKGMLKAGVMTLDIDQEIEKFIKSKGARPAFRGFNGYPANSCISIDDVVVHGIPGVMKLENGNIVGIDIGVEFDGYYGDAARTYPISEISPEKKRLLEVTEKALYAGIEQARPNHRLYDISHAVQTVVEAAGFSVVRELVGHGIGRQMHEEPQIPNYGHAHQGPRLKSGMVFAIEPMVNMGTYEVVTDRDHWTVRTKDRKPSAHFEHTIVITDGDPVILSLDPEA
jgi:methionyl aminopeptidase